MGGRRTAPQAPQLVAQSAPAEPGRPSTDVPKPTCAGASTRADVLNGVLVELMRSEAVLREYQRDPDGLAARHGLTDEERERFKTRDMGWLYVQGVHPYI